MTPSRPPALPAPGDSPATCASRVTRSHRSATSCIWRAGRFPCL